MAKPPDSRALRPNELSIPLVPNRLSIFEEQRTGPTIRPDRRRAAQPTVVGRRGSGRRISLSGILTAVVILFILASRVADLAERPSATAPRSAAGRAGPGHVVFGRARAAECFVADTATAFRSGQKVWWTATFTSPRDGGDSVRWRVLHSGVRATEEVVASQPGAPPWDILCASAPLILRADGNYRFEVLDIDDGNLLAADGFTILSGP